MSEKALLICFWLCRLLACLAAGLYNFQIVQQNAFFILAPIAGLMFLALLFSLAQFNIQLNQILDNIKRMDVEKIPEMSNGFTRKIKDSLSLSILQITAVIAALVMVGFKVGAPVFFMAIASFCLIGALRALVNSATNQYLMRFIEKYFDLEMTEIPKK